MNELFCIFEYEIVQRGHTSLDRRKDSRRQKRKHRFKTQILKSTINCHPQKWYQMKAEVSIFQTTYVLLHTDIHELHNVNFKRRWKFDGTRVFSAIQTSV